MEYSASHRFARISPTKVRPIADLIRGKSVGDAADTLKFLPNRGAKMLERVLKSAVANAEDLNERRIDDLVVLETFVDEGPRIKRIRPRARGMAYMILKRMSHIHIKVGVPR